MNAKSLTASAKPSNSTIQIISVILIISSNSLHQISQYLNKTFKIWALWSSNSLRYELSLMNFELLSMNARNAMNATNSTFSMIMKTVNDEMFRKSISLIFIIMKKSSSSLSRWNTSIKIFTFVMCMFSSKELRTWQSSKKSKWLKIIYTFVFAIRHSNDIFQS